jgi:spermidine synthase
MAVLENISDPTDQQVEQIIQLYRQAGWWPDSAPDDIDLTRKIIQGSQIFIAALEEDEIIGMGRAISDGISDAYIQDVTVRKDFRGSGIATRIIEMIIKTLQQQNINWIGVIAENNTHPLYQQLGFEKMSKSIPLLYND